MATTSSWKKRVEKAILVFNKYGHQAVDVVSGVGKPAALNNRAASEETEAGDEADDDDDDGDE